MDIIKKSFAILVLLLIVVIAWVGFSIYFEKTNTDVNPNAQSYTSVLKTYFDEDELSKVTQRTEDSFPVSPQEFLSLTEEN